MGRHTFRGKFSHRTVLLTQDVVHFVHNCSWRCAFVHYYFEKLRVIGLNSSEVIDTFKSMMKLISLPEGKNKKAHTC